MIEFPHLMLVVSASISLISVLTTVIMGRGKAAADKVAQLEMALGGKASVSRMGAVEERVGKAEERVTRAESRLESVPDKDASHRLELAISRLEGRMETMDERLKPVAEMASRVHERMFEERVR